MKTYRIWRIINVLIKISIESINIASCDRQRITTEIEGENTHDFGLFSIEYKESIEATLTTIEGILPRALLYEMREAFRRSYLLIYLRIKNEDPFIKQEG